MYVVIPTVKDSQQDIKSVIIILPTCDFPIALSVVTKVEVWSNCTLILWYIGY